MKNGTFVQDPHTSSGVSDAVYVITQRETPNRFLSSAVISQTKWVKKKDYAELGFLLFQNKCLKQRKKIFLAEFVVFQKIFP